MKRLLIVVVALLGATGASVYVLNFRDETPPSASADTKAADPATIARGEYLARIGGCRGCHTLRGGAPFAGGRGIPTPFGVVYASNLTPERETGLGNWNRDDFWRALHNGRSKDGRFLYPAFPYTNYTEVAREDADALFAYFASLPPVRQENREHDLRFPYDSQWALAIWRALFFRPGVYVPEAGRDATWNRGAYLVRGLAHCSACHSTYNVLGAISDEAELAGGLIPMQGWYAPSLTSNLEAGLGDWEIEHIVDLLRTGVSARGSVLGPMAEVVQRGTQYLNNADARAIAIFVKSLPQAQRETPASADPVPARLLEPGQRIYENRCVDCHGSRGEGVPTMYPPLAGNRAVTMESPSNVIRVVLNGGFPPGTAGNPRPFGMPPFAPLLSDEDVAAVITYIRNAWGNQGRAVLGWEVGRQARGAGRD